MKIGFSLSRKISDGNFGSVEVSHWLEDSKREEETLEEAKNRVYNSVRDTISEKINKIQERYSR